MSITISMSLQYMTGVISLKSFPSRTPDLTIIKRLNSYLQFQNHPIKTLFMLSFNFAIVYGFFEWKQICTGFLPFAYICIVVGDPVIKRRRLIPINWFNPATCLCLSQTTTRFSNVICRGPFLCSVKMRRDCSFC